MVVIINNKICFLLFKVTICLVQTIRCSIYICNRCICVSSYFIDIRLQPPGVHYERWLEQAIRNLDANWNSLYRREVKNKKSPRSTPLTHSESFPTSKVVINKQDSSFQNWFSLSNFEIYSAAVELIAKQVLKEQNLHVLIWVLDDNFALQVFQYSQFYTNFS